MEFVDLLRLFLLLGEATLLIDLMVEMQPGLLAAAVAVVVAVVVVAAAAVAAAAVAVAVAVEMD